MSNERTAEEWGRVAVGLPGFDWTGVPVWRDGVGYPCRGPAPSPQWDGYVEVLDEVLAQSGETVLDWCYVRADKVRINPDDRATEGCLLALLGPGWSVIAPCGDVTDWRVTKPYELPGVGSTLGRACIDAAKAKGEWPRGAR